MERSSVGGSVLVVGVVALCAAGYLFMRRDVVVEVEHAPAAPASSAPAQPTAQAADPLPQQKAEPVSTGFIVFPDGSRKPPLNGVKNPAKLAWGSEPFSPIVRTENHNGVDWYRHADGSYTTTQMKWRSDLGRDDAVTLCIHPKSPAPVDLGDLDTAAGVGKK